MDGSQWSFTIGQTYSIGAFKSCQNDWIYELSTHERQRKVIVTRRKLWMFFQIAIDHNTSLCECWRLHFFHWTPNVHSLLFFVDLLFFCPKSFLSIWNCPVSLFYSEQNHLNVHHVIMISQKHLSAAKVRVLFQCWSQGCPYFPFLVNRSSDLFLADLMIMYTGNHLKRTRRCLCLSLISNLITLEQLVGSGFALIDLQAMFAIKLNLQKVYF